MNKENVSSKYEEKVKRIMLMIELESGKAFVAKVTDIGKPDKLATLKDLTRKLSNDKDKNMPKFESPVVFTLDLRQAAREYTEICLDDWFDNYEFKCERCKHIQMEWNYEGMYRCVKCGFLYDPTYLWIKHFFNLDK